MSVFEDAIKLGVYSRAIEGDSISLDLAMTLKFSKPQLALIKQAVAKNKADADRLIAELVGDMHKRREGKPE